MNKADVLLGLQWGDEGKGKIVDVLTPKYDIIARFQGGPNAGHTLEFNGIKHVLHTIPSGIFHPTALNVVGNGVVIDPVIFKKEIDALVGMGVDVSKKLVISKRAHLILPTHRLIDAASEASKCIWPDSICATMLSNSTKACSKSSGCSMADVVIVLALGIVIAIIEMVSIYYSTKSYSKTCFKNA